MLYILGATLIFIIITIAVSQIRLRKHKGVSREAFILAFREANVPAKIPAVVYDYYKRRARWKQFTVAPEDSYEDVFHEGDEEIADDERDLVKKLGIRPPAQPLLEELRMQWRTRTRATHPQLPIQPVQEQWGRQIKSLRDMVLWLDWIHRHQEPRE